MCSDRLSGLTLNFLCEFWLLAASLSIHLTPCLHTIIIIYDFYEIHTLFQINFSPFGHADLMNTDCGAATCPPYLLGLITDGKSSSTKHRSLTPPSRHVKDQQREHKRAHPVITLPWLSVNEINKEPVTFQENRQRSSSSTETWKPVSLVALSRAFAAAGFAFAGSPRAL